MRKMFRQTTPKVKLGIVHKRNNWVRNRLYDNIEKDLPIIDKEEAGIGYKHLLRKQDIFNFIELLPDWNELSLGLDFVLLARGRESCDGWYRIGKVAICAWDKGLWQEYSLGYFSEHKHIFDRLGLDYEAKAKNMLVKFTENKAKAYQLLHVFLHELGHHHDRMTTKRQSYCVRGESFAEQYATTYSNTIWNRFCDKFKID